METFYIPPGKDTPEIYFGPDISTFQIEGVSFPSNPMEFYEPVFIWLRDFLHSSEVHSKIELNFKMDYFNTSTLKHFTKIMRIIDSSPARDFITVNWFYDEDDADMLEAGKRLKQFTKTKFEFKSFKNEDGDEWNIEELM